MSKNFDFSDVVVEEETPEDASSDLVGVDDALISRLYADEVRRYEGMHITTDTTEKKDKKIWSCWHKEACSMCGEVGLATRGEPREEYEYICGECETADNSYFEGHKAGLEEGYRKGFEECEGLMKVAMERFAHMVKTMCEGKGK